MSLGAHETHVVPWHHTAGEKPVGLEVVIGELARTGAGQVTLVIPGWGENDDTAQEAVTILETEFGIPAAAWQPSYNLLPPTKENLWKAARDAPNAVANHVGQGKEVNVLTHSLGSLAVIAIRNAKELYGAVGSDSPHALACGEWGKLPFVGSIPILRPAIAAKRLLVETGWQLREYRSDPRFLRLVDDAISGIRAFGRAAWSTTAHSLSDEVVDEVGGGYVELSVEGHPILIVVGSAEKVVPLKELRRTLHAAASAAGLAPDHFDDRVIEVPSVPHKPWFLPGGAQKLRILGNWLVEQSQPSSPKDESQQRSLPDAA